MKNKNTQVLPLALGLYLRVTAGILFLVSNLPLVQAQNSANDQLDSPSQRWLPQPTGDSRNQSWLDRLNSPVESKRPRSTQLKPPDAPVKQSDKKPASKKLDPPQAEQLRELIRQYRDQIPRELKPKNLDNLSDETIGKALSDPQIQEQVREMIERYRPAKDQNSLPTDPRDASSLGSDSNSPDSRQNQNPSSSSNNRHELERSMRDLAQQLDRSLLNDKSTESPIESSGSMDPSDRRVSNGIASNNNAIRRKLEQSGLDKTLKELIDQAKIESKIQTGNSTNGISNDPSSPNASPSNSIRKDWLDSVVKKIDNISKNEFKKSEPRSSLKDLSTKDPSALTKANVKPLPNSPAQGKPKPEANDRSWNKAVADTIKDWNHFLNTQAKPRSNHSSRSMSGSNAPTNSNAASSQPITPWDWNWPNPTVFQIVFVFLCIIVVGSGFFFLQRRTAKSERRDESFAMDLLTTPTKIRSRSDVVRAFHQLAFRIASPMEHWWTSNRIASHVNSNTPTKEAAMSVAKDVYERSRYLPDEVALTDEQLDSIRSAIRTLEGIKG